VRLFSSKRPVALPVVVASAVIVGLVPAAAAAPSPPYQHTGTITEPNTSLNDGFGSFDISWVDSARDVYYLADRAGTDTNGTFIHGRIVAADADDGSLLSYIGSDKFAGNYNNPASGMAACAELPRDPRNGPNGVLTDAEGFIWVGDGNRATGACANGTVTSAPSTIDVFDPNTGTLLKSIDNGGNRRADELAFGQLGDGRGRILISNPEEVKPSFPFATLIGDHSRAILGKIIYDQVPTAANDHDDVPTDGHGWDSSLQDTGGNGGLEQDVWDPDGHVFLLNVPATLLNPGGEIDVISPFAQDGKGKVLKVIPLDNRNGGACNGSGLAISGEELIVQCGGDIRVLREDTGTLVHAPFSEGAGADEIWFNPGDGNVYQGIIGPPVTATAGIGILDLKHLAYLGVVAVSRGLGTHSVAADSKNNRIFFPMGEGSVAAHNAGNGGIGMFHRDDSEPGHGNGGGGDFDNRTD
jgi:hypothetical protein